MNKVKFVWDGRKDRLNQRKHRVSFEEARTIFYDENAKVYFDPDRLDEEDRFIILGLSISLRVLVVCHCYRDGDDVIRIISARKADKREQQNYLS